MHQHLTHITINQRIIGKQAIQINNALAQDKTFIFIGTDMNRLSTMDVSPSFLEHRMIYPFLFSALPPIRTFALLDKS
jgi:hypothetical protein